MVERLSPPSAVRGNEIDIDPHAPPDENLVMELRARSAVEARKTMNKNTGDGKRHDV
jgi:hypothetical protein